MSGWAEGERRARSVVLAAFVFVAMFTIFPSAALAAATFVVEPSDLAVDYPSEVVMSAVVYDPAGIRSDAWWMKLDGKYVRARFKYTERNVFTGATITYTAKKLQDGVHNAEVSVLNYAGQRTTMYWSFTVREAPRVTAVSPLPGEVVTSETTVISALVTDNSGTIGLAAPQMQIRQVGAPAWTDVAADWNDVTGVLSYQLSTGLEWAVGLGYEVQVRAVDSEGNVPIPEWYGWSFSFTYPNMTYPIFPITNAECVSCHPTYPAEHTQDDCDACHGYDSPIGGFYGPPDYHPPGEAAVMLGDCVSCHFSSYSTVPMHPFVDDFGGTSLHSSSENSCTTASSCHNHASLLPVEHTRRSLLSPSVDCNTCHLSSDPVVQAAIQSSNTDCQACHGAGHPHPDPEIVDPAVTLSGDYTTGYPTGSYTVPCQECHVPELVSEHTRSTSSSAAAGCDNCHPSPRDTLDPWDTSCVQDGCHPAGTPAEQHGAFADAHTDLPSQDGKCTGSGCHAAADLGQIHVNATSGAGSGCLVCHSDSSVPDTKYCMDCHPEKVEPSGDREGAVVAHGYDAARHTGTPPASLIAIDGVDYGPYACSDCHELELKLEHEKPTSITSSIDPICAACHPEPYASLPPPWDKTTCAQGNCHAGTSSASQHGGIDAAHQRDPANNQCATSGCHTADVAAIHANGPDCVVCHGSGVPDTKNCLTAGCHPDKVDDSGNVIEHGYDEALHTSTVAGQALQGYMYPAPGTQYYFEYFTGGAMRYGFWGGLACGGCHNPELGPEHLEKPSSSSYGQGCAVCHAPGGPVDSLPPTGWDGSCTACHPVYHGEIESKHSVQPAGCYTPGDDYCHWVGSGTPQWKPDYAANHNDYWYYQISGIPPWGAWPTRFPANGCALTNCHDDAVIVPTPLGCGEGSYCHPEHPPVF